jgi:hypothetical protein
MITITSPIQNQFHQRDSRNNAIVKIAGSCDLPCKLIVKLDGKTVQEETLNGNFQSYKILKQGVYTAEFSINDIVQRTVTFAVGRVFLCTGHSFAEGVGSAFVQSEKVFIQSNIDGAVPPLASFTNDTPMYKKIKDYAITDVNGSKNEGIWGQFAENLSKKDDCPVLIYHSSWGGTSVKQWAESASGSRPEGYAGYSFNNPSDCPYFKTRNILKYLIKNTGLEAVLIMHGENDTNDTAENITANYNKLITAIRLDANDKELPIYVSRSTWRSDTERKVISAQNTVIEKNTNVYAGPDITTIGDYGRKNVQLPRQFDYDEHLNAEGQKKAAALWADSIKDYHNKTVVGSLVNKIPFIGGSSANVQSSNVIGSLAVFVMLVLLNRSVKLGFFGIVGAFCLSVGVYFSNIFNIDYNENSN